MPTIQLWLDKTYNDKFSKLITEDETRQDTANRLIREIIDQKHKRIMMIKSGAEPMPEIELTNQESNNPPTNPAPINI